MNEPFDQTWSPARRVAFRFAALYFVLFSLTTLPWPLNIPTAEHWPFVLAWIGERLFGLDMYQMRFAGGGSDRMVDYIQLGLFGLLAGLGCLIWTVRDRDQRAYPRLAAWLTVVLRYWLASYLLASGIFKVAWGQFGGPGVVELSATYGESTPSQMLWTFVGYSPVYNTFIGTVQLAAGLLLFSRRTTTLGALLSAGLLAHAVALNLGYDMSFKLVSMHMLVAALVLLGLDSRRLISMFVLNRPVPARPQPSLFATARGRQLGRVVAGVYIGSTLLLLSFNALATRSYYAERPNPPLYGLYQVLSHERDGQSLADDPERWRQIVIGHDDRFYVDPLHGPRTGWYQLEVDEAEREISAMRIAPETMFLSLRYEEREDGTIVCEGEIDHLQHRLLLRRVDEGELPLARGRLHWISD